MPKTDSTRIFIGEIYIEPPQKKNLTDKTIIKSFDDSWSMEIFDLNDYFPEKNRDFR